MKKFILNLQFIFKPSYWMMNESYDPRIDELMNSLLDKFDFTDIKYCTAKLGKVEVWIGNQPYSCMYPYLDGCFASARPSRLTIQKGIRKLNKAIQDRDSARVDALVAKCQE